MHNIQAVQKLIEHNIHACICREIEPCSAFEAAESKRKRLDQRLQFVLLFEIDITVDKRQINDYTL